MFRFRQVKQQFKVIFITNQMYCFWHTFFVFVTTNYLPTLLYFCTCSKYGLFTFNQQLSFCGPEAMVSSLQRNRHNFFKPLLCAPPLRKRQFWLFVDWTSHLGNYKQFQKNSVFKILEARDEMDDLGKAIFSAILYALDKFKQILWANVTTLSQFCLHS